MGQRPRHFAPKVTRARMYLPSLLVLGCLQACSSSAVLVTDGSVSTSVGIIPDDTHRMVTGVMVCTETGQEVRIVDVRSEDAMNARIVDFFTTTNDAQDMLGGEAGSGDRYRSGDDDKLVSQKCDDEGDRITQLAWVVETIRNGDIGYVSGLTIEWEPRSDPGNSATTYVPYVSGLCAKPRVGDDCEFDVALPPPEG